MAVSPRQRPQVERIIERWTIDSILASLQILSECRARMRGSSQGRLLIEVALARIARLEDLTELTTVVERLASLESGIGPAPRRPDLAVKPRTQAAPAVAAPRPEPAAAAKSIPLAPTERVIAPISGRDVAPSSPAPAPRPVIEPPPASNGPRAVATASETADVATAVTDPPDVKPTTATMKEEPADSRHQDAIPLDLAAVRKVWPDLFKKVGARLGVHLSQVEPVSVIGPDVLVIAANPGYNSVADECGTEESLAKIEQALQRLIHRSLTVKYERSTEVDPIAGNGKSVETVRQDALASDPLVQRVVELFEARPHRFDYDDTDSN
jgi:DNA polymerase III subunit gamma/tau